LPRRDFRLHALEFKKQVVAKPRRGKRLLKVMFETSLPAKENTIETIGLTRDLLANKIQIKTGGLIKSNTFAPLLVVAARPTGLGVATVRYY
jgi:hypothetical protein